MNPDEQLRKRLAEVMSSAGLGYNQISLEVLYLLPSDFVQRYIWLWEKALGPAGPGDAQGQQAARDGGLGKAQTKTQLRGTRITGASATGKKWKRMGLAIRDEKALALKDRVDRRLRAIGRDIEEYEGEGTGGRGRGGGKGGGIMGARCPACGKLGDTSWNFCPYDGARMTVNASRKSSGKGEDE